MRISLLVILAILVKVSPVAGQTGQNDFPVLKGPYLGQKEPGDKAELFAPGIVSTGNFEHSSPVFSPDLTEVYWSTIIEENKVTVLRPTYYMKMVNGVWTEPEIPTFGKKFPCCENPFITPDGKKLFFTANKTIPPEIADIFYVDRSGNGWGEPVRLGEPINTTDRYEGCVSVSANGTIFYNADYTDTPTKSGLYFSRLQSGKYQKPVYMDAGINVKEVDWTCYIAPDESYFIFCSFREGGFGSGDLYICFRQKNGSWSKPLNMGDKINTNLNERFPNVTPDGKYLFFNSTKKIRGAASDSPGNGYGDMYWISAKIIDELKIQAKTE